MFNRIKKIGMILAIVLIINLFFNISIYASSNIESAGDIMQIALPITAAGLTLYKNDHIGTTQFLETFITAMGITYALKYAINARRPNGGNYSFPSGHTSASFAAAAFLQKRYGLKYGLPAYIVASFVGWSRIESNNHHVRDVIAGAAIGILSAYIFTNEYKKGIIIIPIIGPKKAGVVVNATY